MAGDLHLLRGDDDLLHTQLGSDQLAEELHRFVIIVFRGLQYR